MKVGIITFWHSTENYGQILQCYALQQFLRNIGYDAFLIKYTPQSYPIKEIRYRDVLFVGFKIMYLLNLRNLRMSMRFRKFAKQSTCSVSRHFDLFFSKHIIATEKTYHQHSLYDNPPKADIYITGSDQVWRMPDECYFLDFVPDHTIRIAYAPSFGNDNIPWFFQIRIRRFLSKFNAIFTREESGQKICSSLGRKDAKMVPDPTLLLDTIQYEELIPSHISYKKSRYLFLYMLGNKTDVKESEVYTWAKQHDIVIKHVASCGGADHEGSLYPNIEEWIALIRDAEYIVTNSFHGMVFSILFNKRFVVLPLSGEFARMNDRLYTTTTQLGLSSRVFDGHFDMLLQPIDYTEINKLLIKQREEIKDMFSKYQAAPQAW